MSIIVEKIKTHSGHYVGVLLLNRPQVLNALNLEMCRLMLETLNLWKADTTISSVFIHGNGEKGFCAGGDVKFLREQNISDLKTGPAPEYALDFFAYEYLNDYFISQYPKPIIIWGSGITMGGGIGIYQAASHRIATESSLFCMPEIHIGFFPDVGGSFFLNKMPPGIGLFMGMTAARINALDSLEIGLSDFYIQDKYKGHVIDDLLKVPWTESAETNHILTADCLNKRRTDLFFPSKLKLLCEDILPILDCTSPVNAVQFLEHLTPKFPWLAQVLSDARKGSPLSIALAFEQIRRGKNLNLLDGFAMEYQMAINLCLDSDFMEGVRSKLVDKNSNPQWKYSQLESVDSEVVQNYFKDPFNKSLKSSTNRFQKLYSQYQPK